MCSQCRSIPELCLPTPLQFRQAVTVALGLDETFGGAGRTIARPTAGVLCVRPIAPADAARQYTNVRDFPRIYAARDQYLVAARIGEGPNIPHCLGRAAGLGRFVVMADVDRLVIHNAESDGCHSARALAALDFPQPLMRERKARQH